VNFEGLLERKGKKTENFSKIRSYSACEENQALEIAHGKKVLA
jgi:hypothetical protein